MKKKQNKTKQKQKTEDRFLKALGVVAFGLTVITFIKSLNLINPFKKSLLFSCSFFHVVDRTTWKSTLQDINTTLKEHKTERGRSRVDSCFAILVAHQLRYGATNREALLKITRSLCFRTLTFNSNTNRTTPHRVSPRGQESKCRVDVTQRKYRMDKTNLRNMSKTMQKWTAYRIYKRPTAPK